MTPEEIKELQDKVAELETSLAEKDAVIAQKTKDIVGARKETQKLKELSEREKDAMTEKEIEIHNATLALQEQQESFQKEQQEIQAKEIGARRSNAIKKLVGEDAELAKKVERNIERINGYDKLSTEEEISNLATEAFNMLGVPRPNPIGSAISGGNGNAGQDTSKQSFADTDKGKAVAQQLGIQVEAPKA